ncbi:hypothetical protein BDN67DRAFT_176819 [Paxillus ammoniavirescens]|nr:hypothetical protein BDN67DRAFT_176819 [Paxillus ammoniavirescens]
MRQLLIARELRSHPRFIVWNLRERGRSFSASGTGVYVLWLGDVISSYSSRLHGKSGRYPTFVRTGRTLRQSRTLGHLITARQVFG